MMRKYAVTADAKNVAEDSANEATVTAKGSARAGDATEFSVKTAAMNVSIVQLDFANAMSVHMSLSKHVKSVVPKVVPAAWMVRRILKYNRARDVVLLIVGFA